MVNEDLCKLCGAECCKRFVLEYPKSCSELILSSMKRFKYLKTELITVYDMGDTFHVVFEIPCKYLNESNQCDIYDDPERPLLCRIYPQAGDMYCPFMARDEY